MKVCIVIFSIVLGICNTVSAEKSMTKINKHLMQDTVVQSGDSTVAVIDEVIKSRTLPKKEKVKYVNQVTKYGFKSLFKNFTYSSAIPYSLQVNPLAERYMQDYLQAHRNHLQNMKGNSILYFNLIDNIFMQYGLPRELKYLAVIESDLRPGALSWAGASGPWQFMSYTAKDYGLMVNGYLDERTDYFKSTHAAARYLLALYKDLKDWLLVIAAYNGGPGRVYSAIKKSGSRNFWSLQYYLPTESRNHVKKFIATHYIMEGVTSGTSAFDYAALNARPGILQNVPEDSATDVEMLPVSGKYVSVIVAKNLVIDIAEFNRLNPDFDVTLAAGNEYKMRVAPEKMKLFSANKYVILNECVQLLLNDVNVSTKTTYNRPANKPLFKGK